MRPPPKPRHLAAALILIGVAAVYAYLAMLDSSYSEDQLQAATAMRKLHDPSLYVADPVFGPSGLWRLRAGAFERLMVPLYALREQRPLWPMRVAAGPVSAIYLLSMYALLFSQTRSWPVAVVVAVLSSVTVQAAGGAFWGAGPLWTVSPMGLAVALTPLAALALAGRRSWRRDLWAGLVVLAGAQVHMGWTVNLAMVLSLACLADRRDRRAAWRVLALLGALVAGTAASLWLRGLGQVPGAEPATLSMSGVRAAFALAGSDLLYPRLLDRLAQWALMAGVLAAPSVVILLRMERYRLHNLRFWLAAGGAALLVGLVLSGVAQVLGASQGRCWYVGFPMAVAIVLLPIWVLLAQALTVLFRIFRSWRRLVGWLLAILGVLWFLPSDNVRVIRRQAYTLASSFMAPEDKPRRLTQIQERRQRDSELERIARWASRQTDPQAVFLNDQAVLRARSGRSLAACPQDLLLMFYLQPARLEGWRLRLERMNHLLQPAGDIADSAAIRQLAVDLAAGPPFDQASQWYVVLPVRVQLPQLGLLEPVEDAGWGQHFRVYRIH
jgi:hypothetical protein